MARRRSVPCSIPLRWAQSTAAARCSVPLRWHKALARRAVQRPRSGGTRCWCCAVQRPPPVAQSAGPARCSVPLRCSHVACASVAPRMGRAARGFSCSSRLPAMALAHWPLCWSGDLRPVCFPSPGREPASGVWWTQRATYSAPHGACFTTRSGTGRQHAGDRHDEGANPPRRSADRRAIAGPTAGRASHKHGGFCRSPPATGLPFRGKGARDAGASAGKPRPSVSVQACLQFP